MAGRGFSHLAASLVALLLLAGAASAQNLTANQSYLGAAAQYAHCKTNFTAAYIGGIVSAVPRLSGLGKYSAAISSDASQLSSIAGTGNITRFGSYLSGNYDRELNAISVNVSAQVRSANLTANQISQLRLLYNRTLATYSSCRNVSLREAAQREIESFNDSIANYQKEADGLSQKGINSSSMDQLLLDAKSQIVVPLAAVVGSATNASQVAAALDGYCLFDGCKNGTNFHLAAHFELDRLTSELNYLGAYRNLTAASTASAQADLNYAADTLQTVGTKSYAGGQSAVIFSNLTAASKAMQQAASLQAFGKEKAAAANIIASYNGTIGRDRSEIVNLTSRGYDTAGLNQTLENATSQVLLPLRNALNSSSNLTQLYSAFKGACLENGCANGTNFHLAAKLKIGEAQAELAYLSQKAAVYGNVITVNSTALSTAQAYIDNASAVIGSVGGAQITNEIASKINAYAGNFSTAVKDAYLVKKNAAATVRNAIVRPVPPRTANSIPANVPASAHGGKHSAGNSTGIAPRPNNVTPGQITISKNGTAVTANQIGPNTTVVPTNPAGPGPVSVAK